MPTPANTAMPNVRGRMARCHSTVPISGRRYRTATNGGANATATMTTQRTPKATTSGRPRRTATAVTASTTAITPT